MENIVQLENSYYQLGSDFYQQISPEPVIQPQLFLWNEALADGCQIGPDIKQDAAQYFSGNATLDGSIPLAQAYAGHQFGGFNPQLGDGRAHLLGELILPNGRRVDLQLKGSGATQFSRRGDGRCAFKPAVREYLMSEAMYALGVPTTRTLAVVTTGETLYRELTEPGAIVTRIAQSHIRIGTFQYFAAQGDSQSLSTLLDYAIARHYPEIDLDDERRAILFLDAVIEQQIKTIVHWMRVGFIHGVMNTDNMTISGETIDYGPCAMLGVYHPETVFSSIDGNGRYCFANQPSIMQWNMARLAECLIPLIEGDKDAVIKQLEQRIVNITEQYKSAYYQMMHNKLGLLTLGHNELVDELLDLMQLNKLDYTQQFYELTQVVSMSDPSLTQLDPEWLDKWLAIVRQDQSARDSNMAKSLALMQTNNPVIIPRNHHVEKVLEQCKQTGSNDSALDFLKVLRKPYEQQEATALYQDLPLDHDNGYQTFCGT
ncbi:protein adenylyltransferase SelO [Vibrio sp. MA40-2]|uniref:protein adenylyltransferase SelO n=1 Tax=Vibrio sp. MA40-2 TaxID=3391828 RepID=UPI0039A66794